MKPSILIYTALALFIGYAPNISPYYLSLLYGTDNIHRLSAVEESSPGEKLRSFSIAVPENIRSRFDSVSVGITWPSPSISCSQGSLGTTRVLEVNRDKNSPQVIQLGSDFTCTKINLAFAIPQDYPLTGVISGTPFASSTHITSAGKRFVELLSKELRIFLLIIVLTSVLFQYLEKHIRGQRAPKSFVEMFGVEWAAFLLLSSGVVDSLFPIAGSWSGFGNFTSYVSALAHIGPGAFFLSRQFNSNYPKKLWLYAALVPILLTDQRMLGLAVLAYPIGISIFVLTTKKRLFGEEFIYSILLLTNMTKLLGGLSIEPSYLPHIQVISIFVGLNLFDKTLRKVQMISKVAQNVSWLNQLEQDSPQWALKELIKKISIELPAKRVTLLEVGSSDACSLFSYKLEMEEPATEMHLEKLPPVFASVITSGVAIVDVKEDSELSTSLKKGQASQGSGETYSVFPLKIRGIVAGAIAITGYQSKVEDSEWIRMRDDLLSIHSNKAAQLLDTKRLDYEVQNHTLLFEIKEHLESLSNLNDKVVFSEAVSNLIKTKLQLDTFIFELTSENLYLETHRSKDTRSELIDEPPISVPTGATNQHGPFPLALKNRRNIFVNRIDMVSDVLSQRTNRIFKSIKTRSLAIIPDTQFEDIARVYMISSTSENDFLGIKAGIVTAAFLEVSRIFTAMDNRARVEKQKQLLNEFVPKEVLTMYNDGKGTRIESEGYLACFDFVGSTKLLNSYGKDFFLSVMKDVADVCKEAHGVELYSMHWDAFFVFSKDVDALIQLNNLLNSGLQLPTFIKANIKYLPTFRTVITFGDCTRDISEAEGLSRWTIVGEAMAQVCKLEATVKTFPSECIYLSAAAIEQNQCSQMDLIQLPGLNIYQMQQHRKTA